MAIGTVPSYLQNASHSASVFRIAQSAPFVVGGILAANELPVSQQASPNMSVILGPGRAQINGTSVSPPSGQAWSTQAMYTAYNDSNLTLTIAASNPTNPRIDSVYIQIQDAFYSGATNTAVAAVATGTPAVSPVAPSIPANSILIANIAVAANATTIVTANIAFMAAVATLIAVAPNLQANTAELKYTGAGISCVNATSTQVTWDGSDYFNFLTAFTYNRSLGTFVCTRAGTYDFRATNSWPASSGSGIRQLFCLKALAATPTAFVSQPAMTLTGASSAQLVTGEWRVTLAVGDVVEFQVAQSSGSTLVMPFANLNISQLV